MLEGMKKSLIAALFIGCAASSWAKDKRVLTQAEMQAAYNVAVNRTSSMLKSPSTATYSPIEQATIMPALFHSIGVNFWVEAQNSYGAMLREQWHCNVKPRSDGEYRVHCFSFGN